MNTSPVFHPDIDTTETYGQRWSSAHFHSGSMAKLVMGLWIMTLKVKIDEN